MRFRDRVGSSRYTGLSYTGLTTPSTVRHGWLVISTRQHLRVHAMNTLQDSQGVMTTQRQLLGWKVDLAMYIHARIAGIPIFTLFYDYLRSAWGTSPSRFLSILCDDFCAASSARIGPSHQGSKETLAKPTHPSNPSSTLLSSCGAPVLAFASNQMDEHKRHMPLAQAPMGCCLTAKDSRQGHTSHQPARAPRYQ